MVGSILAGVGGVIIVGGFLVMAGGVFGLLRFPDFYTRLHAVNVSDTLGGVTVLLGLAVVSGDGAIALRLLLVAGLFVSLGPTLSHLLANAAHAGGLAPLSGAFTAPRPGRRPNEAKP